MNTFPARRSLALVSVLSATAIAALVAVGPAQAAPRAGGGSTKCAAGSAVSLGQHPYADLQTTTRGREIRDTEGFAGKVYWGFGDYGANTGPIQLAGLDPATGAFTTGFSFRTEAVERFRQFSGSLFAPATDPSGGEDWAFARAGADHAWSATGLAPALKAFHVYDVAERVSGELYLAGSSAHPSFPSSSGAATVWRSLDNGATWEVVLAANETGDTAPRFYNIVAFQNRIYVTQGYGYLTAPAGSWIFDGSTWSRGPVLGSLNHPDANPGVVGGKLVWATGSRTLATFDGVTEGSLGRADVVAHEIAAGRLLTVQGKGSNKLYSTSDLSTWACQGSAPSNTMSVGLLNGVPYFGGKTADIYKYNRAIL